MATNAELQAQLTEMTTRADKAEKRITTLTSDLASANERADQEAKARQEADTLADTLTAEVRDLTGSLKAYKGSATKLRGQVTILKRELSPEARTIGAMKPAKSEEEEAARAEALEAAFAADTAELAFSDGRREIRELAPLVISGEAWRETPTGRVLNAEPLLEPGPCQRQQLDLRGFALLNEAGEQVAYCALPEAIAIASGTRVALPLNTIKF